MDLAHHLYTLLVFWTGSTEWNVRSLGGGRWVAEHPEHEAMPAFDAGEVAVRWRDEWERRRLQAREPNP